MKVGVTGATGFIGSRLSRYLSEKGHTVVKFSRRPTRTNGSTVGLNSQTLDGLNAVVHLAGERIVGRWTAAKKMLIRESRGEGTRILSQMLVDLPVPPKVLITASAIGFYGDRGEEKLTETSPPGSSFLADVCRDWEQASNAVKAKGIRVVNVRTGIVLAKEGGALATMLFPFKLGVGGTIGSGRQFMSWISMPDLLDVYLHALTHDDLSGPLNAVSPQPVTNLEFTKTLGAVLSRPTVFPLPAFAARLMLGEMAEDLLLASARVIPKKLQEAGFEFRFPRLKAALENILFYDK